MKRVVAIAVVAEVLVLMQTIAAPILSCFDLCHSGEPSILRVKQAIFRERANSYCGCATSVLTESTED
jgi:hypothetical protein